ncbi:conserved domain protein [Peptoniphilus sp. oral taxon 375 str. F0436]|nr:conserved domain protein [Peptoniphilus sp. oral taxon 375 str. F0436]
MIELNNVVCKLRDRELFKIEKFTFEDGSSYLFKGRNGSGKSTLLTAILGYGNLVQGKISSDQKITYQPQQIYLYKKQAWTILSLSRAMKKSGKNWPKI